VEAVVTDARKLLKDLEALRIHIHENTYYRLRTAIESLEDQDAEIEALRRRMAQYEEGEIGGYIDPVLATLRAERDALAARCEALESFVSEHGGLINEWARSCPPNKPICHHIKDELHRWLSQPERHTVPASLAAHDRKVLEEAWERVEEGGICLSNAARLRFKAAILGPTASETEGGE
jgi:hypothetical protein